MSVSPDTAEAFLDTNVLIYAHAVDEGAKHTTTRELVRRLIEEERAVISTQVLNEFYWISTRPHRPTPLSHDAAAAAIHELTRLCTVQPLTEGITLTALAAVPLYGFSFWDALIWAAAKEHGATILYSEDFQHDRIVEGVRFVNPFLELSQPQHTLDEP